MAQSLSQPRIEGSVTLEPTDISFLRARIFDAETQVESLDSHIFELTHQRAAKLAEIASLETFYPGDINVQARHRSTHVDSRCYLCGLEKVIRPLILGPGWVKVWVNQSRGLPLDLYLNFKIFVVPPPTKSGQFMETTLDFGHKLRLLNLKGHISIFLPLFRLPRSSLPQLEQAYLEISSYATQDEMQVTANLLRLQVPQQIETFPTPQLEDLTLRYYRQDFDDLAMDVTSFRNHFRDCIVIFDAVVSNGVMVLRYGSSVSSIDFSPKLTTFELHMNVFDNQRSCRANTHDPFTMVFR
ncbi:hypothetical protein BT96DRAFT_986851 [Gymnopus androsaceus JB14]|uniref:Uncharacterized protein n=1 Tax=Gymnopus androsaceus JB14 TaxID=1447944 RepID=A0A6A4IF26_9AGAR|nr:hypothetical protein BT96DRAFT_986851 [Gymnopus androsaceus JB14]